MSVDLVGLRAVAKSADLYRRPLEVPAVRHGAGGVYLRNVEVLLIVAGERDETRDGWLKRRDEIRVVWAEVKGSGSG